MKIEVSENPVAIWRMAAAGNIVPASFQIGRGLKAAIYSGPVFHCVTDAEKFLSRRGDPDQHYVIVPYTT